MKTPNKIIFLLLFISIIFSCKEVEPIDPIIPSTQEPGIKIFGTFNLTSNLNLEEINEQFVELSYDLAGTGSLNLMEIASIQLNYKKSIEIINDSSNERPSKINSSTINKGTFKIKGESGEEIYGDFGGHLKSNKAGTEEYIKAYIVNGTHQYSDCRGSFTLTFVKNNFQNGIIKIDGKIHLNEISLPK
ncbi:hypothetical protein [Flexithrix dorotheae]|uniref:hypothetical protein n=1 Tax=Flexithrix dorotheae TaxID=70993 RepID=UPI00037AFB78|nr:hypothetical protein [Flexithrix dorotheae]